MIPGRCCYYSHVVSQKCPVHFRDPGYPSAARPGKRVETSSPNTEVRHVEIPSRRQALLVGLLIFTLVFLGLKVSHSGCVSLERFTEDNTIHK